MGAAAGYYLSFPRGRWLSRYRALAAPGYEAAAIRPVAAANAGASVNLFEGGRIRIGNEPVTLLIRMAFHQECSQRRRANLAGYRSLRS